MEDEREFRRCLKIHGYVSSSEDANDSDNSKRKLDELYMKLKPPPVEINPDKHQIIIISGAFENRNSTGRHLEKSSKKSLVAVKNSKRKNKMSLEVVPNLSVSNRFSALTVEDTTEDEMGNGSLVDKEETLNENQGIFTNVSASMSQVNGVLADNSKRNNNMVLEAVPNLLVSNRFSALAVENTIEDEMENASSVEKEKTLKGNQGIFTNVSGIGIGEDKGVLADSELTDEDEMGLFIIVERKFKRRNARHTVSKVHGRLRRV